MPKITITTDTGTVVCVITKDEVGMDLTKTLARQALLNDVIDGWQMAKKEELKEEPPRKSVQIET